MMMSRQSYGWSRNSTSATPKETQQKWQVCYHSIYGGWGEIGYQLFKTKEEAETFAEKFQQETIWVKDTFIRHPAPIYSNY